MNLEYPYPEAPPPGGGDAIEIVPGLFWLTMPIPGSLGAINIWAADEPDGWTIIDTGMFTPETVEAWRCVDERLLRGRPVRRVIATHMHPDHVGMAGFLCREFDSALWMTQIEFLMLRLLASYRHGRLPDQVARFYRGAGWDDARLADLEARFGEFGDMVDRLPESYRRISHGDVLEIGGSRWTVLVGSGHSPEHASLYSAEHGLLIAGDQVLPRISSNVSVYPIEPEGDPLSDWLGGLARIAASVPPDALVLPAHGLPFIGLQSRVQALIREHEERLSLLLDRLSKPCRAVDVFDVLFRKPVPAAMYHAATGESLSHLHCLRRRGLIERAATADGVHWWQLS